VTMEASAGQPVLGILKSVAVRGFGDQRRIVGHTVAIMRLYNEVVDRRPILLGGGGEATAASQRGLGEPSTIPAAVALLTYPQHLLDAAIGTVDQYDLPPPHHLLLAQADVWVLEASSSIVERARFQQGPATIMMIVRERDLRFGRGFRFGVGFGMAQTRLILPIVLFVLPLRRLPPLLMRLSKRLISAR